MRVNLFLVIRLLVIGFFALSALWIVSQFLGKTIPVYAYDSDLGMWVIKQDSAIMHSLEGRATSYYGRHGLNRTLWTRRASFSTNIILWGDSFVEALNVEDMAKPDAVLTRQIQLLLGQTNLVAWGVGESGLSCAGQIVKLKKYEKVLGKPLVHIVLTTSGENDFGPIVSDSRAKLVTDPTFRIVPQPDNSFRAGGRGRELLSRFRFNFVRDIINACKSQHVSGLIFFKWPKPGSQPPVTVLDNVNRSKRLDESANFLLKRLREETDAPILVVYCPRVPQVRKGIVDCTDHGEEDALLLKEAAKRNGIDFLDVTPVLVRAYTQKGVLCMGFQNGQLGYGHLNERGIEIVFSEIAKYLKDKYVVHTN
jgi:hypothetical protein